MLNLITRNFSATLPAARSALTKGAWLNSGDVSCNSRFGFLFLLVLVWFAVASVSHSAGGRPRAKRTTCAVMNYCCVLLSTGTLSIILVSSSTTTGKHRPPASASHGASSAAASSVNRIPTSICTTRFPCVCLGRLAGVCPFPAALTHTSAPSCSEGMCASSWHSLASHSVRRAFELRLRVQRPDDLRGFSLSLSLLTYLLSFAALLDLVLMTAMHESHAANPSARQAD